MATTPHPVAASPADCASLRRFGGLRCLGGGLRMARRPAPLASVTGPFIAS